MISLESVLVWKRNNQTSFLGGLLKSKILQYITEQGCSVIFIYKGDVKKVQTAKRTVKNRKTSVSMTRNFLNNVEKSQKFDFS